MEDLRQFLTNQALKKKFNSEFDLVTHAIQLAENRIKAGKEADSRADVKNFAYQILQDILNGKDELLDVSHIDRAREEEAREAILRRAQEKRRPSPSMF